MMVQVAGVLMAVRDKLLGEKGKAGGSSVSG